MAEDTIVGGDPLDAFIEVLEGGFMYHEYLRRQAACERWYREGNYPSDTLDPSED